MYELNDEIERLEKIVEKTSKELNRLKNVDIHKFSKEVFVSFGFHFDQTYWCLFSEEATNALACFKSTEFESYELIEGSNRAIFDKLVEDGEIFVIKNGYK